MNGYLLDTNVVSLLSPSRAGLSQAFAAWLDRIDEGGLIFLSAVTIHELERGVELLRHKGATAKARDIGLWISGLLASYGDRILPVDASVAATSGRLEARAMADGHNPGIADALIAGTAKVHSLTIVTKNRRHFEPFDLPLESPDSLQVR